MWRAMLFVLCLCLLSGAGLAQTGKDGVTPKSADDYLLIIETTLNELEANLICSEQESARLAIALTKVQGLLSKGSSLLLENEIGLGKISLSLELSAKQFRDLERRLRFWRITTGTAAVGAMVLGSLLIFGGSN